MIEQDWKHLLYGRRIKDVFCKVNLRDLLTRHYKDTEEKREKID